MSERDYGIDASDFRDAAKALERAGFERQAGRTVAWALRRAANAVRRNVRAAARPHRRTGRLSAGVRTRFTGVGMDFEARVKSTGPVAHLVAGGVRPHTEGPPPFARGSATVMALHGGKGAALTVRGGRAVEGFARSVSHPGFRGDPYFHRGVKASAADINSIVKASAETMAKELAYRMRGKA